MIRFMILVSFILSLSGGFLPTAAFGETPTTEVKLFKGTPTLFINGIPNAGMSYLGGYITNPKEYGDFGKAGVDIAFAYDDACRDPLKGTTDQYDFSNTDKEITSILSTNPNAYIMMRVNVYATEKWKKEHPDELMRFHDGSLTKPMARHGNSEYASWASEIWRKDTAHTLQKLIEHIQSQPYGDRVIGYCLMSGGTGEWYYYPNFEWFLSRRVMDEFLDYSKPQTKAFQKWLKDKYKTVEALRSAWHNDTITFETAQIASKEDKLKTDMIVFYDPAKSQHVIDTFDFEADIVVDTIAYFCKVVKDTTKDKSIAGALYGYITGAVDKVYLSTYKYLENPYIDFMASPSDYDFRELGTGYSTYRSLLRSVQLHNKLWWDENDYSTYLVPHKRLEGWVPDIRSTEMLHLRQVTNQIMNAAASWWFDMDGSWYAAPDIMQLISRLNTIVEKSIYTNRSSAAEIAIVVDEKSLLYMELGGDLYRPLIMDQRFDVNKIGAPADWLLMDDLDRAQDYKMYVFLSAFHVTDVQKKAIERLYKRGTKAIVWVYAPGLIGTTINENGCYDVTGLKLKLLYERGRLYVKTNNLSSKMLPGVESGLMYGAERTNFNDNGVGPMVIGDDPTTDVLGILWGFDEPGLITKNINGVQVYFSSAPKLPSSLLRGIAVNAGVHIYNFANDVFYANNSFVGIHTATAGKRILRFQQPTDLYDVYNEKVIATQSNEVTIDLPVRYTALYFRGSEKEWKALNK